MLPTWVMRIAQIVNLSAYISPVNAMTSVSTYPICWTVSLFQLSLTASGPFVEKRERDKDLISCKKLPGHCPFCLPLTLPPATSSTDSAIRTVVYVLQIDLCLLEGSLTMSSGKIIEHLLLFIWLHGSMQYIDLKTLGLDLNHNNNLNISNSVLRRP